jgi:YebC/PmpR family DNA-binding regulatory protein
VRASEVARRHLWSCAGCRAYQRDLRATPSRLRRLASWSPWGVVAQLLGGGGLAGVPRRRPRSKPVRNSPSVAGVVCLVDEESSTDVASLSRLESPAMAGHSKWAGIKHKKAIVDSRRGKLFTKLARGITVAAKEGGGDIVGNAALGLAVQKAKDASMPKDNIERAIAKGTGAGADADAMEAVMYEGYGPGGVAMLVEAFTDNRNRTGSDIRHAFAKHGGNLGEPGSVAYLFDKKGVVVVEAEKYSEDDLMPALDAGAEDIVLEDEMYEILCEPSDLTAMRAALVEAGIEIVEAQVMQRPKTLVPLDEEGAVKLMKLIDTLEDLDDTDTVHANFDVDAEILERVAG